MSGRCFLCTALSIGLVARSWHDMAKLEGVHLLASVDDCHQKASWHQTYSGCAVQNPDTSNGDMFNAWRAALITYEPPLVLHRTHNKYLP